ncbi:hypothetical protein CW706_06205 [Candidatus Bathyarchaeota archaeon]|nr:MAG: hypothetical protein CW706_06205 [Candidatus Bathyarchaeota archaeon]
MGIDVGTTNIAILALDIHSRSVETLSTVRSDSEVTSKKNKAHGWSGWDAEKTVKLVFKAVATAASKVDPRRIEGIAYHFKTLYDKIINEEVPKRSS